MQPKEYDLIAIGGGTAGLVSAAGAAYLGVRAALVEKAALGGDCLWTGCVPSKALLASARLAHAMRNADELGLVSASPAHAFSSVMARMREARGVIEHHDDPQRFRDMGITVEFGSARFVARDTIEVEGVGRLKSKRIVLATGALPVAPQIPGLAEAGYLDHHTIWNTEDLPIRLAVLGAGPIGIEMAQVFARLGSSVTVIETEPRILPRDDVELTSRLQSILEAEGIELRLGTRAERIEVDGGSKIVITDTGEPVTVSEIFVATGRKPAIDSLELDRAGIETRDGGVVVDDRLRTSNRGAWAAGDVTGGMQFTHVADYMAKTVLRNALIPGSARVNYDAVPTVTYSDPELAHVGLSHEEAQARGGNTFTYPFADLDRAIVDGETRGLVKITADKKGRIMAASILGSHAGDLLQPLVLAKRTGLTLNDIADTIFPYPTMAEGVLRAANAFRRTKLDSAGGRVLTKVISWLK